MKVIIEPEEPGDSRALFRLLVGEKVVAEGMTAVQIHILIGEILEQMTLQRTPSESRGAEPTPSHPAVSDEAALARLAKDRQ